MLRICSWEEPTWQYGRFCIIYTFVQTLWRCTVYWCSFRNVQKHNVFRQTGNRPSPGYAHDIAGCALLHARLLTWDAGIWVSSTDRQLAQLRSGHFEMTTDRYHSRTSFRHSLHKLIDGTSLFSGWVGSTTAALRRHSKLLVKSVALRERQKKNSNWRRQKISGNEIIRVCIQNGCH